MSDGVSIGAGVSSGVGVGPGDPGAGVSSGIGVGDSPGDDAPADALGPADMPGASEAAGDPGIDPDGPTDPLADGEPVGLELPHATTRNAAPRMSPIGTASMRLTALRSVATGIEGSFPRRSTSTLSGAGPGVPLCSPHASAR